MHRSGSFLLRLCLSLLVSTGSCTCKTLHNDIQSEKPEELYSQLLEEDLLKEEDTNTRMENLLGTMKEGFLRKLNLSDVPQEHSKIYPPQFMMELYNKYASDSSAIPQSDVIRSFGVQGTQSPLLAFRHIRNMFICGCTEEKDGQKRFQIKSLLYSLLINDLISWLTPMSFSYLR